MEDQKQRHTRNQASLFFRKEKQVMGIKVTLWMMY